MNNKKFVSKDIFDSIQFDTLFKKIPNHPLELWAGVNSEGHKALRYFGDFVKTPIGPTAGIMVRQLYVDNKKCLEFSLDDPEFTDIFYAFCDDIVSASRVHANKETGYAYLKWRYIKWKQMFLKKKSMLSKQEIMGLIGELYFLREKLIPVYTEEKALRSWTASEPTIKDFSLDSTWFELKTIGAKQTSVIIDSLEQLDSNASGHLVVIRLETMAASYDGLKLNSLVSDLRDQLALHGLDQEFDGKLLDRGYVSLDKYDEYCFELLSLSSYLVDSRFPALRKRDVNEAVESAEYKLNLSRLSQYMEND